MHELSEPLDSLVRELLLLSPFMGGEREVWEGYRMGLPSYSDEVAEPESPLLPALGCGMLLRPGHVRNQGGW